MHRIKILLLFASGLISCTSNSIKEKINHAGDIAGQATGEFIQGASKGVEKAFDVDIQLNQNLISKGIQFGKATVTNDSIGIDNLLVLYVIFNQDFKGKLTAKAFDDKSLEMGRATIEIAGKKDETKYIEFHFDKRTNIDSKNKLTVE
jgi:hypothetical protein